MLTSSCSSPARAKSRRRRGSRRFGIRGIEEAHRDERPLAVRVQRLDLVDGRRREARRAPHVAAHRRDAQLVGDDLHGRGEVERRVIGIRRNRRDDARSARARRWRAPTSRCRRRARRRRAARRRSLPRPPRARRARAPRTRAAARRARSPATRRRALRRASRRCARASSTRWHRTQARRLRDRESGAARRARAASRPIVSIARAAAPMLPGWLGATRTMRRRESRSEATDMRAMLRAGQREARLQYRLSLFARGPALTASPRPHNSTMHPMLTIAVKAARRAGNIINRGARDLDLLTVTAKGPKDFVSEVDREAERPIVETLLGAYPDHAILAEEGTAKGANAERRERLDHRSARRHDQLPARLSAVLRVDRARASRPGHAGGHLRPGAQRSLHGDARARRVPERPPHPRLAARAPARLPDRHRLPVSRRQLPRHLSADDEDDDRAAPPACAVPAPPRSISPTSRPASTTASGRSGSTRGTSRRAACWCRRPAGSSAICRGRRLSARRAGDRRESEGLRADGHRAHALPLGAGPRASARDRRPGALRPVGAGQVRLFRTRPSRRFHILFAPTTALGYHWGPGRSY